MNASIGTERLSGAPIDVGQCVRMPVGIFEANRSKFDRVRKGNMRRTFLALLSVFALAMAVLAPLGAAGAAETPTGLELAAQKGEVAKSPTGSYIVVMKDEPLIVEFGQDGLDSAGAQKERVKKDKKHDEVLAESGASASDKVNSYTNALNGFSAILSYEEAQALASDDSVSAVIADELQQPDTDSSPEFIGVTGPAGPWQTGYDGEGVVVGIIDSGIWPEHPSFADDGSLPAAPILDNSRPSCDFGNTAHNANDVAFECNDKLIGARQMLDTYRALLGATPTEYDSARDDNGHGTHTASTAAGNADVAASIYGQALPSVSGVAPRAHVIAYKGLGVLGGFTSDLASAIDQAVFDGVDVINYSIGGGAALPGGDEIAFLFAAADGVFIATSAGNSGPGISTLGNPGTVPWITTVGASTQSRSFEGTVVLGNGTEVDGVSITLGAEQATLVDAEFAGGDLCVPGTLDEVQVSGNIVLCRRGAIPRAEKSLAVFQAGGIGTILYNNSDDGNLYSDTHWTPTVHIDNTPGVEIKAYIASAGASASAEIVDTQSIGEWESAPSMTDFSSRGPNPVFGDLIKPDITAPGIQILAGNTPTPQPGDVQGELFQAIAGTSMSSPHIAGVFALIKQAHPDWSEAQAKSAIMTTAYQDVVNNDRTSAADPFDMGSGHVDPGNKVHKGSAFQPGLVYDAGLFEYAGFTCGADLGIFTPGSCDFLESIGVPLDSSDLNYPSIAIDGVPGSQTVTRTVTSVADDNGWRTYNAAVDAPAGYEVTVSPSTFRLKSGQSTSYEVTITNVSAPIGVWRFGSLTWEDQTGNYRVYSPIAVSASLFDAPTNVTGSGTSGSTSFDVTFGYTGDYTAAPHGLSANAPALGSIGQDPDQTYPSGDDAPGPGGGVDKIDFIVADSALVRWSLDIPGPDDIDLYLENSGGTRIAESTSGGTDELIELVLPADDTYTLVVHGWSVPNAPLAYSVNFWDVPLTPGGGSLTLDSAPASATIGTVGTVGISWAGLSAGVDYLGAVSHSDAGEILGFTTVEIDG
jgi:subtilisin family serine protease